MATCYLLPSTNDRIEAKLKQELHPGARVVSNTFSFAGLEEVCEERGAKLYWLAPTQATPRGERREMETT